LLRRLTGWGKMTATELDWLEGVPPNRRGARRKQRCRQAMSAAGRIVSFKKLEGLRLNAAKARAAKLARLLLVDGQNKDENAVDKAAWLG